jgi:phycocyanobilin lyase alpha subunit
MDRENFNNQDSVLTVEKAIANLQQQEDLGLRYYAAWWLGRFRVKETAAIDALLAALEDEEDRAPDGGFPLRRNAAKALGKLEDPRVVPALIRCLDCDDYYVRESAAQALEMLGDPRAISPLRELLQNAVGEEGLLPLATATIPGKPYLLQPYEAIIEALGTLQALQAISSIEPFIEHPVPKVQYAAARAMYQLTQNSTYGEMLVRALEGDELQLRRSALMDLGAIGYVNAGDAIADTLAENSLKLIAMKGLLEHQVQQNSPEALSLCQRSIELMNLMDGLL